MYEEYRFNLQVNLLKLVVDLRVECRESLFAVTEVVNDPSEDALEALRGVLHREDCFQIERALKFHFDTCSCRLVLLRFFFFHLTIMNLLQIKFIPAIILSKN